MSKDIRIKKGLNINLIGEAEKTTSKAALSNVYAINLLDFHGITPKMIVKPGAEVKAGEPLFYNKEVEDMLFVSPVSGELVEVERGARRKILSLRILADKKQEAVVHTPISPATASAQDIRALLLKSGCWPFIKQRPYDVIADPEVAPKAIFISAYVTSPLSADLEYSLKGKEKEIRAALTALGKLTPGKIHVSIGKGNRSLFSGMDGIEIHQVSGPHPAGLVGTQINKIDPVNKGEVVWTIAPQDLVVIGE
ncbi:MAG TPA: hypothetical protein VLZ54_02355, partial [Arenibacter sp.]|nr:hypothetical protein [Arenibacter sp.]